MLIAIASSCRNLPGLRRVRLYPASLVLDRLVFSSRCNRPELLPSAERPAPLSAALSSPAVAQFFELSVLLFLLPTAANQKELCITAQLHSACCGWENKRQCIDGDVSYIFVLSSSLLVECTNCRVQSTHIVCVSDFREG